MSAAKNAGQMTGDGGPESFATPSEVVSAPITGVGTTTTNLGEKAGFVTRGYLDKKGTVYGEAAKLNAMPPGMDIDNQDMAVINDMPLKRVVAGSYPGDGGFGRG